jgi:hypothetical protein
LRFDEAVDSETGVGEGVNDSGQGSTPEVLRDLNVALLPGVGHELGIELAAVLRRERRREGMVK